MSDAFPAFPLGKCKTRQQVCNALKESGINAVPRTLTGWFSEGCPEKEGGYYSLLKIERWRMMHKESRRNANLEEKSRAKEMEEELHEQRVKFMKARTSKLLDQSMPIDEVKRRDIERIEAVRSGLLTMPKIASRVARALQQCRDNGGDTADEQDVLRAIFTEYGRGLCGVFEQMSEDTET